VYDPRFVAGHLWWTDNEARSNGAAVRQPMMVARQPMMMPPTTPVIKPSTTITVGCGPGGNCRMR